MRNFPQELVDKVIDELDVVTQPFYGCSLISNFSTVSRQWVERTQKHHFRQIWLYRRGTLEQWRTTFDADPCGPSRHVRQLELGNIVTFQGFEDHLRAFTQVEEVHILGGWILESVPEVQRFTMIGSNLKSLRILSGWTTPQVVVSLLAGLPHLRSLDICITFDCGFIPPVFPPSIPFFEGANTLFLRGGKYRPGGLDWIPSTARLGGLSVDIRGIYLCLAPVNRFLASSGETLEWFTIGGDDSPTDFHFSHLDFSNCTSSNCLRLLVPLDQPGQYVDNVLPSISSSRISRLVLQLCAPYIEEVYNSGWEGLDKRLSRLAERFKAAHGGRKMEVTIYVLTGEESYDIFNQLKNKWPMPELEKEANTAVLLEEGHD